ncbi:MAG: hypothetical protein OXC10_16385 [Rhodospirillaceae bacterium]|nr:hypothetical protein [Rhodospirillaceae bacterium]
MAADRVRNGRALRPDRPVDPMTGERVAPVGGFAARPVGQRAPQPQARADVAETAEALAWLADVLGRIAETPQGWLDDLLLWNWEPASERGLAD